MYLCTYLFGYLTWPCLILIYRRTPDCRNMAFYLEFAIMQHGAMRNHGGGEGILDLVSASKEARTPYIP